MLKRYASMMTDFIYTNDSLREFITHDYEMEEDECFYANVELFFLTFALFSDDLGNINLNDSVRELIETQKYYIDGDKIILGDKEIAFGVLEMAFVEVLSYYRKKRNRKIIDVDVFESKIQSKGNVDILLDTGLGQLIKFDINNVEEEERLAREEAIRKLYEYKASGYEEVDTYLYEIEHSFKDTAYEGIAILYNKLRKCRDNNIFKEDILLLNAADVNLSYYRKFAYMLMSCYPIQIFKPARECLEYLDLRFPNIQADANYYRYDDEWEEYEKRRNEVLKDIGVCNIILRGRRVSKTEKDKARKRGEFLIRKKELLDLQCYNHSVDCSDVTEVYDENGEPYYTGAMLNKHILYNLEIALRNGHVDVIKNNGREEMVFYAIVDGKVDFILKVGINKILNMFDTNNLIESIKTNGWSIKRTSGE